MTTPLLAISRFRLKNFKAVRDSGSVHFTPLTVFIGNNGVGKSSLIEGLEMVKAISDEGLDRAMQHWRGFEYVWNQTVPHQLRTTPEGRQYQTNAMSLQLVGSAGYGIGENASQYTFRALSEVTAGPTLDEIFFLREEWKYTEQGQPHRIVTRTPDGKFLDATTGHNPVPMSLSSDESVLYAETSLALWQFVRLNPEAMSVERPLRRVAGYLPLATDGSNIGEYLLNLRQQDPSIIDGIVETLQTVLPYAVDIQPVVTTEIGRSVYLQLSEGKFKIPSWLFSTGTLRVVALLALLRNPEPPPLIVIEELENGLDPRTVNLIVEEIREVVSTGKSQVIITTHSPYLLDLVPLSSLIFVERIDGQPTFIRPEDDESVQRWSQDFAPGKLYTMGKFRQSR
jgi:predicted ATPase